MKSSSTGRPTSRASKPAPPASRRQRAAESIVVRINAFIVELKRRHVFRIAAVYAAGAFVVIQAADLLLRGLGIPDWAFSLIVVLTILGAPIALILAWTYDLTPHGVIRTADSPAAAEPDGEPEARGEPPAPPANSLAVLPFTNLSESKENEYFSDGMTEELIASLARIRGLKVVSRTSVMQYKQTSKSMPVIARELGVANILEGSIRRYGDRVRVTAQLIDAAADDHLWVETYDRTLDDVCGIQCELARNITRSLEVKLSPRESRLLEEPPTESPEAYDLYLRGRFLWNGRTEQGLRQSTAYLERALAADPGFALAAAGLADAWLTIGLYSLEPPREAMERARGAAERALALDGSLAEALAARGCVRSVYDWDWAGAEADFRRAAELNPRYAIAHQWYAMNLLGPLGRFGEAAQALERAGELEPFSIALQTSRAMLLHFQRRHDEAIAAYRTLLEVHPEFGPGHAFLAQALAMCGRHDDAAAASREALGLTGGGAEATATLAYALAAAGRRAEAVTLLDELLERARQRFVSPTLVAQVYIGLRDAPRALHWLRRAHEMRAADLVWLKVRPVFDPLREEPEYQDLLREMGLGHS
jgi:TolB-like protein/tetratricopeptide (TPR) repeat protein